jgi:hypothetical protein
MREQTPPNLLLSVEKFPLRVVKLELRLPKLVCRVEKFRPRFRKVPSSGRSLL